jgi:hypothetical protein
LTGSVASRIASQPSSAPGSDALAAQLDPDESAIFNFHDPPARSGLDMAYGMTAT